MAGKLTEIPLDLCCSPVRLCCSQRHAGPVCADGMVMCCVCFGRYEKDELYVDSTGTTWDMCKSCGETVGEA